MYTCWCMYDNVYEDVYSNFGYNWYYTVGQQSATFVKVFMIERSTIKLKIRNLKKLTCTWDVVEDMKELWVRGLKL